jgi:hypothetical protein
MTEHEASRTLVKSPPELWAECSDAASLTRHLGQFGEIRITRLEPETSVAWEGERASGTVRLEPSGWGTRVVLTARPVPEAQALPPVCEEPEPMPPAAEGAQPEPMPPAAEVAPPEPEPPAAEVVPAEQERGFMARLRARLGGKRREGPSTSETPEEVAGEAPATEGPVRDASPPEAPPPQAPSAELPPETPPAAVAQADPEPAAPTIEPSAALNAALDSLGQAHHRPFSRA